MVAELRKQLEAEEALMNEHIAAEAAETESADDLATSSGEEEENYEDDISKALADAMLDDDASHDNEDSLDSTDEEDDFLAAAAARAGKRVEVHAEPSSDSSPDEEGIVEVVETVATIETVETEPVSSVQSEVTKEDTLLLEPEPQPEATEDTQRPAKKKGVRALHSCRKFKIVFLATTS